MTLHPKIAIVGAGPSGLALALILLKNNISSITILERDASPTSRAQGASSLDLHPRTGQAALRAAGVFDEFKRRARYDAQDIVVADERNAKVLESRGRERGRPEIDRVVLREMLLTALPKDFVRWGVKVERIDADERDGEKSRVVLESGEVLPGLDLVVGADGAWSRARACLTCVKPFYSGVCGYEMRFSDVDHRFPEVSRMAGKGNYFALGDGHAMLIQRQGTGDVKMLAVAHRPEGWLRNTDTEDGAEDATDVARLKARLQAEYAEFAPELRRLLEIADDGSLKYWPFHMLPVGLRWRHRPGVTLIGDAAHLMTPFAGEGVNNALADSLSLATHIVKAVRQSRGIDEAVERYEKEMYKRTEPSAARTWERLQSRFFEPEPARGFHPVAAKLLKVRAAMTGRKAKGEERQIDKLETQETAGDGRA